MDQYIEFITNHPILSLAWVGIVFLIVSEHLSPENAKKSDFSSLEKYKTKPIIVVCTTGMTAQGTAAAMSKAGFERVYLLAGGMGAWQSASLPTTTGR